MAGRLTSDPLFVGLTRPAMIFGVSIKFFALNLIIAMTLFIQSNSIMNLFVAFVIHLIGYIICFKEPRFVEIFLNKSSKCSQCPNKSFYGANSYGI
ncbi:VirB3 family type IV secretion system protein [Candidatus Tisiphia endosymbiont of Nemotelus uliginosus]|uniref:VirB3 family type IV secretion system protein n=1 Tax=Candidatus Tisiphia endosymbiont of Nemotelus uliginosus TaxID=3077926 RepID=UPI0035C8AD4B